MLLDLRRGAVALLSAELLLLCAGGDEQSSFMVRTFSLRCRPDGEIAPWLMSPKLPGMSSPFWARG